MRKYIAYKKVFIVSLFLFISSSFYLSVAGTAPISSFATEKQDDDQIKQAEYNRLIKEGDSLIEAGDNAKALIAFQKASELMPYEEYPRLKLQVIETTIDLKVQEEEKKQAQAEAEAKAKAVAAAKKQAEIDAAKTEVAETSEEKEPAPQPQEVTPEGKPTVESILAQYKDTLNKLDEDKYRIEKAIVFTEIASDLKAAGFHAKSIEYFRKSLMFQEESTENLPEVATIYDNIAEVYLDSGDYETSIETLEKSIEVKEETGDKKGVSENLNKIGTVYENTFDYDKAIDFYERSAEVKTNIDDKEGLSEVMDNIGNIYFKQKILEKSIESYEKSAALSEQLDDQEQLGGTYNKLGVSHYELGDLKKAKNYYEKALESNKTANNQEEASRSLNNLGNLSYSQNQYNKAINFYEQSLNIKDEINNEAGKAISLYNIANAFRKMNQSEKAIPYFEQSRKLAEETNQQELIARNVKVLAEVYKEENNEEKAAEMEELAETFADVSVDIDDNLSETKVTLIEDDQSQDMIKFLTEEVLRQKQLAEAEAEKRARENKIARLKVESQTEQIKRQRIFLTSLGIVVLMVLAVLVLLRIQVVQKKKANQELQEKNEMISNQKKLITDNILSARVIQKAAMPPEEYVKTELPDHFILNMPKDIVSGDFYWMEKRKDTLYVAVADCTGHGVQGAVVSMLGISSLNEIVNKSFDEQPSEILDQLSTKIKTILHSEDGQSASREGMDMALLKIDKSNKVVEFSGAKNPLYLVRNGEVIIYKGDRSPIGYYTKEIPFTTTKISIEEGDSLYMFSDGYIDQLGGKELKKLMARRFQKILIEINDLPMEKRREILVEKFNIWKGGYAQVDDIMVMGITL